MEKIDEIRNSFKKINVETANDILNAGVFLCFSFSFNCSVFDLHDWNFILQCNRIV